MNDADKFRHIAGWLDELQAAGVWRGGSTEAQQFLRDYADMAERRRNNQSASIDYRRAVLLIKAVLDCAVEVNQGIVIAAVPLITWKLLRQEAGLDADVPVEVYAGAEEDIPEDWFREDNPGGGER